MPSQSDNPGYHLERDRESRDLRWEQVANQTNDQMLAEVEFHRRVDAVQGQSRTMTQELASSRVWILRVVDGLS